MSPLAIRARRTRLLKVSRTCDLSQRLSLNAAVRSQGLSKAPTGLPMSPRVSEVEAELSVCLHKHVQSADVDGWHDCQNLAIGETLDKRTSHEVALTPPHSLDPEIRQSTDMARVLRRSPRLRKDGASLRRRRRRLASTMQFAICLYEELAERKGRSHHRRIDGDWSGLSARAGR